MRKLCVSFTTILVLSFLMLMMTGCRSDKKSPHEGFDLQGHRGAMGHKPENTLPSFFKAIDLGVDTIEFDLAVSRDHQLVISHEPWFRSDLCLQPDGSPIPKEKERSFRIYEYRYEEIAKFDCGSLQHPSHPQQQTLFAIKPLMSEAIPAIDSYVRSKGLSPVRYNIEVKSDPAWDRNITPKPETFARLLYDELKQLDSQLEDTIFQRVNVQSFDPRPLHAFREILPTVPLAILTYTEESVDRHIEYFGFLPEIYSPNYGIMTPKHVFRAHELGMRVIPWTVNHPSDMKKMVEFGVDGLITDYPDRFIGLYPE